MKYKFEAHAQLLDEELSKALAATADGLEGESHIRITAVINVNTELPDEMVETLRQEVSGALNAKFGEVETALIAVEN